MRTVLAINLMAFALLSSVYSNNSFADPAVKKVEISKKQAVELAKKNEDGKTLKITDQNNTYTVRILKNDGHVVDVHVNKKTGKVKKD